MQHIYYESDEYEDQVNPGTFAAIVITRDEDGPHFKFKSGDEIMLDLAIPACEALAIAYELDRSGKHALNAAEWVDEQPDARQHADHGPKLLEPGMTPYGPREVQGEEKPVRLPSGIRHELPSSYTASWLREPGQRNRQTA